jgi:hypothetical protein
MSGFGLSGRFKWGMGEAEAFSRVFQIKFIEILDCLG